MNDKIILYYTNDSFSIKDSDTLKLTGWSEKYEKTILASGEIKEYFSFYKNNENCIFDKNRFGLKVTFNPNKIAKKKIGGEVLCFNEFKKAVEQVNERMNEDGIQFNNNAAKLYRYDSSFDIPTKEPYSSYLPLIKTVAPIKNLRRGNQRLIENTLYLGNKTDVITIYNKSEEQGIEEPFARIEARHTKQTRKNIFLKSITEPKYWMFRSQDKSFINDNIFSRNPIILDSDTLKFFFTQLETDNNYNQINEQMTLYSIHNVLFNTNLDISLFLASKSSSRHYDRDLKFRKRILGFYPVENIQLISLYEELREKFNKAS